jgi:hypothetical protein
MRNDHGLFVNDLPDGTVQAVGYIVNFPGHGAFDPSGKVGEPTEEEIKVHNDLLGEMELEALKETGKGLLYISKTVHESRMVTYKVTTWNGTVIRDNVPVKHSWHNFAGRDGRLDVWFTFDGSQWHGVNIGDSQILRVKRNKKRR